MGDYWQLTVDILQNESSPIVDKPKLQEKYLTKPPFRYLHDLITAVQNNTGFAPGLYSGEELDAKGIQDKDAKVAYLQKIIDVVSIVLNAPVPAKPLKIVAGLEPENTNVFLQMLGKACKVENGADAVQRVLGGGQAASSTQRPSSVERQSSRRTSQQQEDLPSAGLEATSRPSPSKSKRDSKEGSKEREYSRDKDRTLQRTSSSSKTREKDSSTSKTPESSSTKDRSDRDKKDKRGSKTGDDSAPPPLAPADSVRGGDAAAPADDAMRRTLMRPQSARKAPPKPDAPAAAAAPAAPAAAPRRGGAGAGGDRPMAGPTGVSQSARPVSVMEEGAGDNSDDDVEVVHEAVPVAIGASRDGGEQGVLVKNIREAERNLKKAGEDAAAGADESAGTGIILGKRLGKAGAAAGAPAGAAVVRTTDTAAIQEMVQKLCQSSHPLAKSMDYLQEDLENMAKEYRFWQLEKRMFADRLATEQRMLGDGLAAETQLADLDAQVKQVQDRILGVKAQLLRNDETIGKLLSMAVGR